MHVESAEEIKAAVRELKIMHLEYDAFRKNLHELSDTSKEILIPYIEKRKEVDDIADELGVSADTVKTRIKRIKKEISFYMEGAMNVYDENIMIIGGIA